MIPVVAECDDSQLNDPAPVQVEASDAGAALAAATDGPVRRGRGRRRHGHGVLRLEGRDRHGEPARV